MDGGKLRKLREALLMKKSTDLCHMQSRVRWTDSVVLSDQRGALSKIGPSFQDSEAEASPYLRWKWIQWCHLSISGPPTQSVREWSEIPACTAESMTLRLSESLAFQKDSEIMTSKYDPTESVSTITGTSLVMAQLIKRKDLRRWTMAPAGKAITTTIGSFLGNSM